MRFLVAKLAIFSAATIAAPPIAPFGTPFSFSYGGVRRTATSLKMAGWSVDTSGTCDEPCDGCTCKQTTFTEPSAHAVGGQLQVTLDQTEYTVVAGSQASIMRFHNIGDGPSSPLCKISLIDAQLDMLGEGAALHTFNGSRASINDYQPGVHTLAANSSGHHNNGSMIIHGSTGPLSMLDGARLWTDSILTIVHNQTRESCVQTCLSRQDCSGVTFIVAIAGERAQNDCYVLGRLKWFTREPGFAGWSKTAVFPHDISPSPFAFGPTGGRSSDPYLPFFAVADARGGLAVSIGWSGNWRVNASVVNGRPQLDVGHGDYFCASLEPGESIRSMRLLTVVSNSTSASADSAAALFNKHRRVMVAQILPRSPISGEIEGSIIASWSWLNWPPPWTQSQQLWHAELCRNFSVEYLWLDAGWFNGGFPAGVGNWQLPLSQAVNRSEWPQGSLRPLADACHAPGKPHDSPTKFMVWFEPERVMPGTYIARQLPEYVLNLGNVSTPQYLLDLGNADARRYIFEYLSQAVGEYALDVLRIDFNIAPAPFWRAHDVHADTAADGSSSSSSSGGSGSGGNRTGITEARYIEGLYSLWDQLLASKPGLMIDDCSAGGRRIDLETLSRSFPLWRSDHCSCSSAQEPAALQSMSVGLSLFAPVSSGAVCDTDAFSWRSAGVVGKTISWGEEGWRRILASPTKSAELRLAIAETKALRQLALEGDLYPLTPVDPLTTTWTAYQFHRPEHGDGFAMFFRNPDCEAASMTAGLRGIDPNASYAVQLHYNYTATGPPTTWTGNELAVMNVGISRASSLLLKYAASSHPE